MDASVLGAHLAPGEGSQGRVPTRKEPTHDSGKTPQLAQTPTSMHCEQCTPFDLCPGVSCTELSYQALGWGHVSLATLHCEGPRPQSGGSSLLDQGAEWFVDGPWQSPAPCPLRELRSLHHRQSGLLVLKPLAAPRTESPNSHGPLSSHSAVCVGVSSWKERWTEVGPFLGP